MESGRSKRPSGTPRAALRRRRRLADGLVGRRLIEVGSRFRRVLTGRPRSTWKPVSPVAGIDSINSDYEQNCRAARAIGEEFFDAEKNLSRLLWEGA